MLYFHHQHQILQIYNQSITLERLLLEKHHQHQLLNIMVGEGSSTMININKTSFENYEIPTPSDNTLQQLEHKLNIIFSAILHNLQEIDRLNKTKDLLVTQLSR